MNEIVTIMCTKCGVDESTARKVVLVMNDYLARSLPEHLAAEVQTALEMPDATDEELRELGLFQIP